MDQLNSEKGANLKNKNKSILLMVIGVLFILLALMIGLFFWPKANEEPLEEVETDQEEMIVEEDEILSDWKEYTNEEYDFEIKYPPNYKEVYDQYGWPNSVVLFIEDSPSGAQAYRTAIEVWDNLDDVKKSPLYQDGKPDFITKIGSKYITLSYNYTPEVENIQIKSDRDQAISTFEFID
ncbi:MAG: hypothetical protein ACOCU8_00430 [Patescibacteria group bacterium]